MYSQSCDAAFLRDLTYESYSEYNIYNYLSGLGKGGNRLRVQGGQPGVSLHVNNKNVDLRINLSKIFKMAAQLTGRLAGKVALVTGASSGIGRATALLFAAEGARVAVTARRDAELTSLVDEITKLGGTAAAFPADLTDDAAVAGVVDGTVARFSSLDILVNNAGVLQGGATGAASM